MDFFPGQIKSLLSDACWNDYHLVLLLSEALELIIADDLHVLQIISRQSSVKNDSVAGSIHGESGKIAICSNGELIVFEALGLYGKSPKWSPCHENNIPIDCRSIAWANDKLIYLTSIDGKVFLYDITVRRVVWEASLGLTSTMPCIDSNQAFSYSPGNSSEVLVYRPSIGTERLLKERPLSYSTNGCSISFAWIVSPNLLVAQTEECCFVWNINSDRLIMSLPLTEGKVPLLFKAGENLITIRNRSQQCSMKFDGNSPEISWEESSSALFQVRGLRPGASGQRYYVQERGFLRIIKLFATKMEAQGAIGGASPSIYPTLRTVGKSILAGSTLLNDDGSLIANLKKDLTLDNVLLSQFIDDSRIVAFESSSCRRRLVFYGLDGKSWGRTIEEDCCALSCSSNKSEEKIYLLRTDSVCEIYDFDGKLRQSRLLPISYPDKAVSSFEKVLLSTSNRLELWDLNSDRDYPIWKSEVEAHTFDAIALSADGYYICAAFNENAQSTVRYWSSEQPRCIKTLTIEESAVLSMDWSPSFNCVACTTRQGIRVFGATSSLRGGLVEVARTKPEYTKNTQIAEFFCEKSTLRWQSESQGFVLFNGRHIVSLGLSSLVSTSKRQRVVQNATPNDDAKDIINSFHELQSPLPIYHPSLLLLCLAALQSSHVLFIFNRLTSAIRLGDTSPEGNSVSVPSLLNLESLPKEGEDVPTFDEARKFELLDLLKNYTISDLTREAQDQLILLVSISDAFQKLDEHGSYALASFVTSEARLSCAVAWIYGSNSMTKLQLLDSIEQQKSFKNNISRFLVWLDRDQLTNSMDQYARKQFADKRDPTLVALYFLAQHNLPGLKALWRISSGHPEKEKTIKLLGNNFDEQRWQTAAHKNAYALLSKRRPEYAAAFFLLGKSIKDCCQVCVDRLNDLELAITIARVYDGEKNSGLEFLRHRYFSDPLSDKRDYNNSKWVQIWLDLMLGRKKEALESLIEFLRFDLTTIFVLNWSGGLISDDLRSQTRKLFENAGIPEILIASFMEQLSKDPSRFNLAEAERLQEKTSSSDKEEEPIPSARQWKKPPEDLQLEPDMSAFGF